MIRLKSLLILLIATTFCTFAQDLQWKTGFRYFFDNTEFAHSTINIPQTMTGVHFTPEAGLRWDSVHSVFVGLNLLKMSGSNRVIDKTDFIAYYQYTSPIVRFRAGTFQREEVLSNYSDLFFQDSIKNFRPLMEGLFFQVGKNEAYANLWLDWTSHQTDVYRETFFLGASAHKRLGFLFADFQSYMYHFAGRANAPADHLCDNALAHLSLGLDYSNKQGLDTLLFAVGVLTGLERDRDAQNITYTPMGAVIRLNVQYRGVGLNNMLYTGQPRMRLYDAYGTDLYWGNRFLRSKYYLESKLYINTVRSRFVNGRLASCFHFSEGRMFFEQTFNLSVSLNSLQKKIEKKNTLR